MKRILVLLFVLILALALSACSTTENSDADMPLTDVTIVLDWVPNINHTGLYVAQANGYFADQGLNVEIIQPGDNYALQLVAAGQAEFGISYQEEVTFARTANIPVISLAAIIQHNTSCFASPADKGIETISDFSGKKYGGWGGEVEEALLGYIATSEDLTVPVEIINIGSADFFAATESSVDFSWIFYGVTGIEAELRDEPINTIFLKDIDPAFDYYTPVIVADETWVTNNPDITTAFMTAVSQGYQFAANSPKQAANILLDQVPELSEDLIVAGQLWLADQYLADADFWGQQKEVTWQGFADWLYQHDLLEETFDGNGAFTNEYLPK
jgi:ABC-type nitrate/sulfonate/bicarbonate transport system substrate-binding protein